MRLGPGALATLPAGIQRPRYDRARQAVGMVHLGIGAFHRAHQAVYTDDAMDAGDPDWAIAGVSLRSPDVANQLDPQAGLYSVTQRDAGGARTRIIGAVKTVLVGGRDDAAITAAIAAPSTYVVSLTITEKGYARAADGTLDAQMPAIANDLAGGAPRSIYGHLEAGLRRRYEAGLGGLTLLSCDNLAHNGAMLGSLLATFLHERDPALARWVADTCTTPSTMVDRIVPATTAADRATAATLLGCEDAAMVVTEPFRQWVIEDRFAGPRPIWEAGRAQIVADVQPFELAKLRMLNGVHSALAYLGLERGHVHVHEAMREPGLRAVAKHVMREAIASLTAPPPAVEDYGHTILARLDNPALPYRLDQIATDGSQKIPQRWLRVLREAQGRRVCPAILSSVGAWVRYSRTVTAAQDPIATRLAALWRTEGTPGIIPALFGATGLFAADWVASDDDIAFLMAEL